MFGYSLINPNNSNKLLANTSPNGAAREQDSYDYYTYILGLLSVLGQ